MWWHTWKARRRLTSDVSVWYHRDYAAHAIPVERRVAHLQTDRAELALARLSHVGLLREADLRVPELASLADLARVHSRHYLEQLNDALVLGRIFGLAAEFVDVDALLGAQRRAVGGTIAAALDVARGPMRTSFNLGGGFHHAAPDAGAGFCVFNDVAVAIARLRSLGFASPIAIVDLDFHQGDGNLAAFANDASVLVYSIHGAVWTERVSLACRNLLLPSGTLDADYLACLRATLRPALVEHRAKLVFYVAGVDVLADDLLGDFALSPRGVLTRDRMVVDTARELGAAVVVTLAGGYSSSAWQCTSNFMRYLLTDVARADRDPHVKRRYRFERVARHLDPWDLQREDVDLTFDEADLVPDLGKKPRRLLLDYYSRHGVELALERYGLMAKLAVKGFRDFRVTLNPDDPHSQVLRVEGRKPPHDALLLLFELVVSRFALPVPELLLIAEAVLPTLRVEWLLLQDPTRAFTPAKPQLPGQDHPGLGVAHDVHEMLVQISRRLHLEGIVQRPAHYHNAVVAARQYRFVDPMLEGRFRALRRVLANVSLAEATKCVEGGDLVLADGSPLAWEPGLLLLPVSERLWRYFEQPDYLEARNQAMHDVLARGLRLREPRA